MRLHLAIHGGLLCIHIIAGHTGSDAGATTFRGISIRHAQCQPGDTGVGLKNPGLAIRRYRNDAISRNIAVCTRILCLDGGNYRSTLQYLWLCLSDKWHPIFRGNDGASWNDYRGGAGIGKDHIACGCFRPHGGAASRVSKPCDSGIKNECVSRKGLVDNILATGGCGSQRHLHRVIL